MPHGNCGIMSDWVKLNFLCVLGDKSIKTAADQEQREFLLLLPSARILFYPYAFSISTVGFLVAASGNNSEKKLSL
jgi:hypothetical protein